MIALIDGDVLKYQCGFASDANAKKLGAPYEDLSFCLQGVRKTIDSILAVTEADEHWIVMSHPVNHRKLIYPEYKANRDPLHKPYWFIQIHDYLFSHHPSVESAEGDEADDALGIMQCTPGAFLKDDDEETIICSIDKDLDGVPGWHYNFSKNRKAAGPYFVTEEEANRFFYKQILTGDSADNIPGLFRKMGQKATSKYTSPLDKMDDPLDMFNYCVECYKGDVEWVKWLGNLLWIKREETGTWLPL